MTHQRAVSNVEKKVEDRTMNEVAISTQQPFSVDSETIQKRLMWTENILTPFLNESVGFKFISLSQISWQSMFDRLKQRNKIIKAYAN